MIFKYYFLNFLIMMFLYSDYSDASRLDRRTIGINPGPKIKASRGEVWPKPQSKINSNKVFQIRPKYFQFKIVGKTCEKLEKALERYKQDIQVHDEIREIARNALNNTVKNQTFANGNNFMGYLDEVNVDLQSSCEEFPHSNMDEHYELCINTKEFPEKAYLISQSIWGILRGLETWSQIVHMSSDYSKLLVNGTSIMDFPKFSHRGLLIDSSRHFLPVRIILSVLDAMVMSKMNVLHWHIVDDQSFPFQSNVFPDLSKKGAYTNNHTYSPRDVQDVILYAAERGVRVIPEFDTPGHTRSWGEGYPDILSVCYKNNKPDGSLGPMNPIAPATYNFMKILLKEIRDTFVDSFIHLGGDEVEFDCWESNPEIREYMISRNLTVKNLQENYIREIIKMTSNISATSIVWQEIFDDGASLPNDTIIHVWKGNYENELFQVTKKYNAILSSCWYLDGLSSGGDWEKFYLCDPHSFPGTTEQKSRVIGGEACMWGEVVDSTNILSRIWPRACSAAEKLWSPITSIDIEEAAKRLEEHTCRMNRRKIPAQPPNGPGFCPGISFM